MIYIVLVNWRGYSDTIECLESLMRLEGPAFKIVVVDNESSESGVDQFRRWARGELRADMTSLAWRQVAGLRLREPTLSTFTTPETIDLPPNALVTIACVADNTGFAAACNLGIRLALSDAACTHVWLLNNDTIVDRRALVTLLARVARDERIGLCGSTLLYYDSPDTIQSLGGVFDAAFGRGTNLCAGESLRRLPATEVVEAKLDYLIGASMLVSRRFLDDIGPMEESYFLYFEELNWSRRARGRFRQAWARDSLIYHKEGASIGTCSRARPSELSLYCYNLNFLRFVRSFHAPLLPIGLAVVVSKLCLCAMNRDHGATAAVRSAITDFLWSHKTARDGAAQLKKRTSR
jgi:GT2 family glycosyltransferase